MKSQTPRHVALIMDGNRRWAKNNHRPSLSGHNEGVKRIEPIIDEAIRYGVSYLTFWAFSTENWNRSQVEVNRLLWLFRNELHKRTDRFHKKNVRIKVIGDIAQFPKDIQKKVDGWIDKTKDNQTITVLIALSYGGRDEILRAIEKWHESQKSKVPFERAQGKKSQKLTTELFEQYLDTSGIPDPDLLIRTGGEKRLSGFLLWQMEYTELYFTDLLWPDFTPLEFQKALEDYAIRGRRFGK